MRQQPALKRSQLFFNEMDVRPDPLRLPFFTVPYEEETIASTVGRFLARFGKQSQDFVYKLGLQLKANGDTPANKLEQFISRLPPGHPWRDESPLLRHSCGPMAMPFQSLTERSKTMAAITAGAPRPFMYKGVRAGRTFPGKGIRYCVDCMRDDWENPRRGVAAYYRVHQVSYVAVCPTHRSVLRFGCTVCDTAGGRVPWQLAGACSCTKPRPNSTLPASIKDRTLENLAWLAQEAVAILQLSMEPCVEDPRGAIDAALQRCALADGTHLQHAWTRDALVERWGSDLALLGSELRASGKTPWLWKSLQGVVRDQVRPLLLISACNLTARQVLSAEVAKSSRASSDRGSVQDETVDKTRTQAEDVRRKKLRRVAMETGGRVPAMSLRLKVSASALAAELLRLRVAVPLTQQRIAGIGERRLAIARQMLGEGRQKKQIEQELCISSYTLYLILIDRPELQDAYKAEMSRQRIEVHKERLSAFLTEHPNATRTEARVACIGAVEALELHAPEWLLSAMPARLASRRFLPPPKPRDYSKQEAEWSEQVQRVRREDDLRPGKPVQMTRTRLCMAATGARTWTNMDQRPRLKQALDECTESRDHFVKRKLAWTIRELEKTKTQITLDRIRIHSGLSWRELLAYYADLPQSLQDRAHDLHSAIQARKAPKRPSRAKVKLPVQA